MNRRLLVLFVLSVACLLGFHGTAEAQTGAPAVVFEPDCHIEPSSQEQVYGVKFFVLDAPSDAPVHWEIAFGPIGSQPDSGVSGDDWPSFPVQFGAYVPTRYELTITSPALGGTVAKTLTVTCEPKPTTVEQCKKKRFRNFGFKNQGQCVAYVRRGTR